VELSYWHILINFGVLKKHGNTAVTACAVSAVTYYQNLGNPHLPSLRGLLSVIRSYQFDSHQTPSIYFDLPMTHKKWSAVGL
jgi:hypothetical protein